MVLHKRIVSACIIARDSNTIVQIIQNQEFLIKNPKVTLKVYSPTSGAAEGDFKEFIERNYSGMPSTISQLVLITDSAERNSVVETLMDCNDKILIVY